MPNYERIVSVVNRNREQGRPDADSAAELGVTRKSLHAHLARARRKGYVTQPSVRGRRVKWKIAADMLAAGATPDEAAAAVGATPRDLSMWFSRVRTEHGKPAPYLRKPPANAAHYITRKQAQGAAPRYGFVGAALARHPAEFGEWLLAQTDRQDGTLADTLIRLVKENLYEPR